MKGYPESVSRLIDAFARLPGIGRRSAERLAFHVLRESSQEAMSLAQAITDAKTRIVHCPTCWNICDDLHCEICSDPRREASIVLVVEQPKDVLAIEKTGSFRGIYHVLLGRLDPLAGVGPEGIVLEPLLARVREPRDVWLDRPVLLLDAMGWGANGSNAPCTETTLGALLASAKAKV